MLCSATVRPRLASRQSHLSTEDLAVWTELAHLTQRRHILPVAAVSLLLAARA
jgi:hypothetical protein